MIVGLVLVLLVAVPAAVVPVISKRRSWPERDAAVNVARAWASTGVLVIGVSLVWAFYGSSPWWSAVPALGGLLALIGAARDLRKN